LQLNRRPLIDRRIKDIPPPGSGGWGVSLMDRRIKDTSPPGRGRRYPPPLAGGEDIPPLAGGEDIPPLTGGKLFLYNILLLLFKIYFTFFSGY